MGDDKKQINGMVNHSFWFEKTHNNGVAEYVSGDAIGTVQSVDVKGDGGGGIMRVINVSDNLGVGLALRIWFFRRAPRAVVDNAPFVLHDNDVDKLAGYRDVAAGKYITKGNHRIAHLFGNDANVDFSCPEGKLYYIVEAQATPKAALAASGNLRRGATGARSGVAGAIAGHVRSAGTDDLAGLSLGNNAAFGQRDDALAVDADRAGRPQERLSRACMSDHGF